MAAPLRSDTGWTAARVLRELVRHDRRWPRYEFVDGEVLVTPAPRWAHGLAVQWLGEAVAPYVRAHALGRAFVTAADLQLATDTVVSPDLFVVPTEVLARGVRSWADVTALLLTVEVLSPGSHRHDRQRKRAHYQRAGVPEYWIVDLDSRLVERWRPADDRPEILVDALRWAPADGVPPLALDLHALFDEACGAPARFEAPPPDPSDDPPAAPP